MKSRFNFQTYPYFDEKPNLYGLMIKLNFAYQRPKKWYERKDKNDYGLENTQDTQFVFINIVDGKMYYWPLFRSAWVEFKTWVFPSTRHWGNYERSVSLDDFSHFEIQNAFQWAGFTPEKAHTAWDIATTDITTQQRIVLIHTCLPKDAVFQMNNVINRQIEALREIFLNQQDAINHARRYGRKSWKDYQEGSGLNHTLKRCKQTFELLENNPLFSKLLYWDLKGDWM